MPTDAGLPKPSRRLVEQRIRNRIIEYLELASSFEAQREFEKNTPIAFVPNEVINLWEDWEPVSGRVSPGLREPYSPQEIEALKVFHAEWKWVADHTPTQLPPLSEVQLLPEWQRLRRAAALALTVFQRRGRLPEDEEV